MLPVKQVNEFLYLLNLDYFEIDKIEKVILKPCICQIDFLFQEEVVFLQVQMEQELHYNLLIVLSVTAQ